MTRKSGGLVPAAVGVTCVLLFSSCERPGLLEPQDNDVTNAMTELRSSVGAGSVSLKRAIPCNGGGSLGVVGAAPRAVNSKGTGLHTLIAVVSPVDCRWTTDAGPITLDGHHLILVGARKVNRGVPAGEITGTLKGRASWTVGAQRMTCNVNANYRIDLTRPRSPTINGKECAQFLLKRFFLLE